MLISVFIMPSCIASGARIASNFFHIILSRKYCQVGQNLPTRFQSVSQFVQLIGQIDQLISYSKLFYSVSWSNLTDWLQTLVERQLPSPILIFASFEAILKSPIKYVIIN